MNSTTKKAAKRKPNDGYEPLTFKNDEIRKMSAKEQGEDLFRILIAGLQRKLICRRQRHIHKLPGQGRKGLMNQSKHQPLPRPTVRKRFAGSIR